MDIILSEVTDIQIVEGDRKGDFDILITRRDHDNVSIRAMQSVYDAPPIKAAIASDNTPTIETASVRVAEAVKELAEAREDAERLEEENRHNEGLRHPR